MSARQLIVLVVAAIAAIGALFLIRGMGGSDSEAADTATPVSGQQVLVAARDVPQGAALTPSDLAVALFPEASIAPGFVRVADNPSAQTEYVGAVTRRAFVQGEPITTSYVVQPEGRGFMAAQLEPGFRAVSIEVGPETAAGGYIQPNDRVDVIMSHKFTDGGAERVSSEIILEDVRVLAVGATTQTQVAGEAPETVDGSVAVLELSAEDARALALADQLGDVTLALRGVQVDTVGMPNSRRRNGVGQSSGAVRIHAYGTVLGGGR
ncbi:MAG: Flp pilus assembly protein CpaB [Phycisphaerales bacterium]|nr:Flp pilus assembly protein CpaB [Hyphomonadaceae bacterium]